MNKKKDQRKKLRYHHFIKNPETVHALNTYDYQEAHLAELDKNPLNNKYWALIETYYEQFSKSVLDLNYNKKTEWTDFHTKNAVMMSKIPKGLFAAFYLANRGYYYEAMSSLRIPYELLLRILYIQKRPNEIDLVMLNKSSKEGNKFKAAHVLSHLYKVSKEQNDYLYSFMSRPLHGMMHSVTKEVIQSSKKEGLILKLGYKFDHSIYVVVMNLILVVMYLCIRTHISIFDPVKENLLKPDYKPLIQALKNIQMKEYLVVGAKIVDQL